jgi:hypothetical protein
MPHDVVRWVMASRNRRAGAGVAALLVIGLVVALVLALTSGGSTPVARPTSAPRPVPSPSPTPTPTPKPKAKPKPKPINPLTGLRPSRHKVVAVKIEDTSDARPQVALNLANIVYIEQVEGGLTRLVAIFNSTLPTRVGPVRSTRNDDPEILRQYGPIIYVASGGSPVALRPLRRSNLRAVINDHGGIGFSRAGNRPIPHNLFANLFHIAKKVRGPRARSIGLHWSRKIANRSGRGTVVRTRVGGTPVVFRWYARLHRYIRYRFGRPDRLASGKRVATPNVIVMFVRGNVFRRNIDPAGNPSWYQHTVGRGRVVVFRGGRRIEGRWIRPHARNGTRLVDRRGKPIALAPGGAWFVLVNNGTPLAR